jgi:hypothetical protein
MVFFTNTPNIPPQTLSLRKRNDFFFFFLKFVGKVAEVGWPETVDNGWQRQLVARGGFWTQKIGLETCIGSVKWANILGLKLMDH